MSLSFPLPSFFFTVGFKRVELMEVYSTEKGTGVEEKDALSGTLSIGSNIAVHPKTFPAENRKARASHCHVTA